MIRVVMFAGLAGLILGLAVVHLSLVTAHNPSPLPTGHPPVTGSSKTGGGNGATEIRFQIKPGITLEYSKGPPGNSVMIFGAGFGANEQDISLTYDGNPVVSGISVDGLGSFQSSFLVPPSGAGPHSIQAESPVSGAADTPGQTFTVSPSL